MYDQFDIKDELCHIEDHEFDYQHSNQIIYIFHQEKKTNYQQTIPVKFIRSAMSIRISFC